MSVSFELEAEVRQDTGKGASRRLRQDNKIPAIMYGSGEDPVSLAMQHDKVMHALENEAFYSHKVILRDMQRHPSLPRIQHMDFQRVSSSDRIHMLVPLHFINEDIAVGVKIGGGLITHNMNELEVICAASDLPEYIEVDVAALEEGHALHISDIKLPAGVESTALSHGEGHDLPVVAIHAKRGVSEEDEAEAAAAADASLAAEGEAESSGD
jgi:large subunit ribosomal protein L25